eukprot:760593-Hanusia_phi.AAC.12
MSDQVDNAERILLYLEKELYSMRDHCMDVQTCDDSQHATPHKPEGDITSVRKGIRGSWLFNCLTTLNDVVCICRRDNVDCDWDLMTQICSCILPDGIDEDRLQLVEPAVKCTKEDIKELENRFSQLQEEARHVDRLVHVISISGCSILLSLSMFVSDLKGAVHALKNETSDPLSKNIEEAIAPISSIFPQVHELWLELKRHRSARKTAEP